MTSSSSLSQSLTIARGGVHRLRGNVVVNKSGAKKYQEQSGLRLKRTTRVVGARAVVGDNNNNNNNDNNVLCLLVGCILSRQAIAYDCHAISTRHPSMFKMP